MKLAIDEQSYHSKKQVGHADHEIDGVIVGMRFAKRVLDLRTGGCLNGFPSARAGDGRPWQAQQDRQRYCSEKYCQILHLAFLHVQKYSISLSRSRVEAVEHPVDQDPAD